MSRVGVLDVMDAIAAGGPFQVCCGMPVGGGYDENGNGEPPSCCGLPINDGDLAEARASVAELIAALRVSAQALDSAAPCAGVDHYLVLRDRAMFARIALARCTGETK